MDVTLSSLPPYDERCFDVKAVPALGRDRTGVLLANVVGLPVHAVLAAGPYQAPGVILDLLSRSPQRSVLVTFVNPATWQAARRRPALRRSLLAFDLALPDGIGMCLAVRWLHALPAKRVSFDMTSLAPALLDHAQAEQQSVILVGGGPGVAARAASRLAARYPALFITATLDGYSDHAATAEQVAALQPDIVICGMGAGEQEAFLLDLRARSWVGWGFTCGGFFDQLQGGLAYYPAWVDRKNLRWAYRLLREPARLWRRYAFDYPRFAWIVCAARLRGHS